MTAEDNKLLVRQYIERVANTGDVSEIERHISPDCIKQVRTSSIHRSTSTRLAFVRLAQCAARGTSGASLGTSPN